MSVDQVRLPPRALLAITFALLVASMALTVYAVVSNDVYLSKAWTGERVLRWVEVSLAFWAVHLVAWRLWPARLWTFWLVVVIATCAALAGFAAVASVAFVLLSSYALGQWIFRTESAPGDALLDSVLLLASGLALFTAVLAIAVMYRVNYPVTWFVLFGIPLLLNRHVIAALPRQLAAVDRTRVDFVEFLLGGAVGNFLVFAVIAALLPEALWDALALHLRIATYIAQHGYWSYDVAQNFTNVMPLAGDMTYAAGFMFGGEQGARMMNLAELALLLTMVYALVRRVTVRRHALAAVLVAVAAPLTLFEQFSLFIENPWSLFLVATVAALWRYVEQPVGRRLFMTATLFGGAMAAKVISALAAPAFLVILAVAMVRDPRARSGRRVALAALLGVAVGLIPYVIAYAKTGNPLFPFYNAIFKSPLLSTTINFASGDFPGGFDPWILYKMTAHGGKYLEARNGIFGTTALALLPAMAAFVLLSRARRGGSALLLIIVSFAVLSLAGISYIRYLYPLLFAFAVLVGWVLGDVERLSARAGALMLGAVAVVAVANGPLLPTGSAMYALPLQSLVDPTARRALLAEAPGTRRAAEYLNAVADDRAVVVLLGYPYAADFRQHVIPISNYTPPLIAALLAKPEDARKLLDSLDAEYAVVDDYTPPAVASAVRAYAVPVFTVASTTVYWLEPPGVMTREVLVETSPSTTSGHWKVFGAPTLDTASGSMRVDDVNQMFQIVDVIPGGRYILSQTSRCPGPNAQMRLQANWLDADLAIVSATIVGRPCEQVFTTQSIALRAPEGARHVAIYANGYGPPGVDIRTVSLRTRSGGVPATPAPK